MGGGCSTGGLSIRRDRDGREYYTAVFKFKAGGKWHQRRVVLRDERGNRIMAGSKSRRQNMTAARRAMERARQEVGPVTLDGRIPSTDYVRADLEARRGAIADTTLRGYLDYVPLFAPLAGVAMNDLSPKDVRLWIHGMVEAGKAPATVRKAYALLEQTCERAVEVGDIAANPCTEQIRRHDLPKAAHAAPNALDAEGVRRVNALLDGARNPRLRVGARLALHAGLRRGECCGLRWGDVDLEGATLHVRRSIGDRGTLVSGDGRHTYAKDPKSKAGTRDVPMTRALAADLAAWRAEQLAEWRRTWDGCEGDGPAFPDCYVLGYADGSHFTPHALGRLWSKLAAGMHARSAEDGRRRGEGWEPGREPVVGTEGRVVTFHDLRHTFATVQVAAGADVKSVSALMGHADASMTLNVYAASDAEARARAMEQAAPVLDAGSRAVSLRAV